MLPIIVVVLAFNFLRWAADIWIPISNEPVTTLPATGTYRVTGEGHRPSLYAVSEFANASVAAVGLAMAIQRHSAGPACARDHRNQRLASLWFGILSVPKAGDAIALGPDCRRLPLRDG